MDEEENRLVAESIREAIADNPKKTKQGLLKTLLRHYGLKNRQKHWLEAIQASLTDQGIIVTPDLEAAGREDWIWLTVADPSVPVGDFDPDDAEGGGMPDPHTDPWLSTVSGRVYRTEKEVEIRFVIPLLERLGYGEADRSDGFPVEQAIGGRKVRTEADFVLFDGANRGQDNALMVVEAKVDGKALADHVAQAKSYAMFLGTPYFMVTNGDEVRVNLYRSPIESHVEVYKASRHDLAATFPALYNLVSKAAVVAYKAKKGQVR